MIRLGLISAASYAPTFNGDDVPRKAAMTHGPLFSCAFNGHDPAQLADHAGEGKFPFNPIAQRFAGVRAVKIWDPVREAAEPIHRQFTHRQHRYRHDRRLISHCRRPSPERSQGDVGSSP